MVSRSETCGVKLERVQISHECKIVHLHLRNCLSLGQTVQELLKKRQMEGPQIMRSKSLTHR